ncbi:MAG: class I SAM-dependent methyltransferase [Terriglobales bacterium]
MVVNAALEHTGERMVPEASDRCTFWEHVYRYRFARELATGARVLDVASGEGYGAAALLASGASQVIGVDVSQPACEHARRKYGIDARVGSAEHLPLRDGCVDLVTSFETIEHLARPEAFLSECARVLRPGGRIVISTPESHAYGQGRPNPFHSAEMTREQFRSRMRRVFQEVRLFHQRPLWAAWWSARSLAAERSVWQRIPGSRYAWRLAQLGLCPEVVSPRSLRRARRDPVATIIGDGGRAPSLGNPFAIRPETDFSQELPTYVIAVGRR